MNKKLICESCESKIKREDLLRCYIYSSPFDSNTEATLHYFCCDECEERYLEGTFRCSDCERTINEHSGHNTNYRIVNQNIKCLQCHEKTILKEGQPLEDYESNSIRGGMFFSGDNREQIKAGFGREGYFHIGSNIQAEAVNKVALDLIKKGFQVITSYESLGICGREGNISLWKKEV